MDLSIVELTGIAGAAIILIAFVLLQLKYLGDEDFVYDGLNFVGGLLLVIYAFFIESTPFLVLNAVWTLVSLRDLMQYHKNRSTALDATSKP